MKITKLNKKQIAAWLTKHVPSEFTSLDLGKLCADFQEAVAKANLEPEKIVKSVKCLNCGEVHDAGSVKLLDIQFYVTPYGCTGGDYWTHSEYTIKCEGCGHMLTIPDMTPWDGKYTAEKIYPEGGHGGFSHRDCQINYKTRHV